MTFFGEKKKKNWCQKGPNVKFFKLCKKLMYAIFLFFDIKLNSTKTWNWLNYFFFWKLFCFEVFSLKGACNGPILKFLWKWFMKNNFMELFWSFGEVTGSKTPKIDLLFCRETYFTGIFGQKIGWIFVF